MRRRSRTCRSILHLGLALAGVSHEFLQIAGRHVLPRDQDERLLGDERDGDKIVQRVIGRMLVQRLAEGMRAGAAEQELIAVGRCPRDPCRPRCAAGARDVLDDDGLAENLRQMRREGPRNEGPAE